MAAGEPKVLNRGVFQTGQHVFREGDTANTAYFVESGEIEIYRGDEDSDPNILGKIGQGGIFGEMGLVDDQPRMASARAVKQTVLISVGREAFKQKLAKTDPFIRGLLTIFVRNIRALTRGPDKD